MQEFSPLIEWNSVPDKRAADATEPTENIANKVALLPTPFTTKGVGQFGILVGREVALLQADWRTRHEIGHRFITRGACGVGHPPPRFGLVPSRTAALSHFPSLLTA